MRSAFQSFFAACIAIALFTTISVSAAPTTQQSIDQLNADDPIQRDAAEAQLCLLGKSAIESLTHAAADPNPEVQRRARRALRQIRLFLLPDVPGNALEIAAAYLNADDSEARHTQLNLLFQIQPPPLSVLVRLLALEPDDDLRHQILYRLRIGYRDQIGPILADDHDLEQVLALLNGASSMWGQGEGEAADDAAAQYIAGNVEQQIQLYNAEEVNGDPQQQEHAASQLCFLYRISGKSNQALLAARRSREMPLVFLVLTDQGDWDEAAKVTTGWQNQVMGGAFRAAFQRLGGHLDRAKEKANALLPLVTPDPDDSFIPSKYLLLNDLPERGMDLLVDRHPAAVFSMRVARGEIDEALNLAAKYSNHPTEEGPLIISLRDDLRRTLGELPDLTIVDEKPINPGPLARAWQSAVVDLAQKKFKTAADEFGAIWEAGSHAF